MDANELPASRARLAKVLRAAREVISVESAADTLNLDRRRAAKLLARWREQGWLRRVGHGKYVPVPLELSGSEQVIADPWVLVPSLFGHCYVGGWTAAHHWDLTEQLFNETLVYTTNRVTRAEVFAQGVGFRLHHARSDKFFGLKTLWRGSTRVNISDPARTLTDMLARPQTGGGIDHVAECLATYLVRQGGDRDLLIRYAEQLGNGAIFKRLGFLAEAVVRDEKLAAAAHARRTTGNAKLDPDLACTKLITDWRLWVPPRWKEAAL